MAEIYWRCTAAQFSGGKDAVDQLSEVNVMHSLSLQHFLWASHAIVSKPVGDHKIFLLVCKYETLMDVVDVCRNV